MSQPMVRLHPDTTGLALYTARVSKEYAEAHKLSDRSINNATVTLSITDRDGNAILEGQPLTYIAGSAGLYEAEVPSDIGVIYNQTYTCVFVAESPVARKRRDSITVVATHPPLGVHR